jgi:hypothetical protein
MSAASMTTGTTTTGTESRSAAEIEREVERSRARLTGTVEELKGRVSPGQVAEQAMDWLRGSGGREFLGNMGSAMRDNPMPVLLVAAGIGWLALAGGRGATTGQRIGRYPGESYPPDEYAGTTSGITGRAGEAASSLREGAGSVAARAGNTLGAAADTGRRAARRAGDALHAASETASDLGTRAARTGSAAREGIAETLERQPLLLGALGLALGAALGALLPGSEAEDRLLGETRDRVASQAGEAWQDTRETLAEHGLTPERGAAALGEVARDLRGAAEDAARRTETPNATGMPPSHSGPESGGPV